MQIFKLIRAVFVFTLLLTLFSFSFNGKKKLVKSNHEKKGVYYSNYGNFKNGSLIIRNTVKPNEFLSTVFSKFDLDNNSALSVSTYNADIFDAKKFKSGNPYAFVINVKDKKISPRKFIYEKNVIEYAVFDFTKDELTASLEKKPIEIQSNEIALQVNGSLYNTLMSYDINPTLAIEMSDIFKWTIDFYRIQEGDFFKVIYDEEIVEGRSIGEFDIKAINFNHLGKDHLAFSYTRAGNEKFEYFDEEGNTLKQFFLQAPVAYSRISSKYSKNRYHPVTKKNKPHLGTDYAAPTGTPIYATANGVVTNAQYKKYNGNYVKIKHNDTYSTQYLHMSKIAKGIKKGVYVQQGQIIGYVGSTGLATGPHVCYRFWKNGKQVDPYKEIKPKADPLPKDEIPAYKKTIEDLYTKITNLKLLNV